MASRLFGEPGDAPVKVGRFVVVERLGAGAMGTVFAAYDPKLDRRVAVKVLHPRAGASDSYIARTEREAKVLARLNHPNVLTIHDTGTAGRQQLFIATEYVDGGTLNDWLARTPADAPQRMGRIIELAIAAAEGLHAAHEAGLVHRDVKPSNLLIGDDGRLRVADFGLAREDSLLQSTDGDAAVSVTDGSPLADGTEPSGIVGTPAYMAPEQLTGHADARSDQFGWGASFYEAAFGVRPFAGDTLSELCANATTGRRTPPRPGRSAPPWFRAVLERALDPDPQARLPTMGAVAAALRQGQRRTGRGMSLAVAATALGVMGLAAIATRGAPEEDPCDGMKNLAAAIWTPEARGTVKEAIASNGSAFARDVAARVDATLDDYATGLSAAYLDVCEDTRVRSEHSEAVLDDRVRCLDTRRRKLAALVDALGDETAPTPTRASQAVQALPALEPCANLAYVRATLKPPSSDEEADAVTRGQAALSSAEALRMLGRFTEAMALAQEARTAADEIGYAPLQAAARLQVASLKQSQGNFKDAAAENRAAFLLAHEAGDDAAAAKAAVALAGALGSKLSEHDEALQWVDLAQASWKRLGQDAPELEAELADARGAIVTEQGKYDEALAAFEHAIELREAHSGPDTYRIASTLIKLGAVHGRRGELDAAEVAFKRALAIFEAALGPRHPETAGIRNNLGLVAAGRGQLDAALAHYTFALETQRDALGNDHADVAMSLQNIGNTHARQGDYARGLELHREALAILEKAVGAKHPSVARSLSTIGELHRLLGDPEASIVALARALAIQRTTLGDDHPGVASTLTHLANLHMRQGELDLSVGEYREALAIRQETLGPDAPLVADALENVGGVLLKQDLPDDALTAFKQALDIRVAKLPAEHPDIAVTRANIGATRLAQGRLADAATQLEQALPALEGEQIPPAVLADAKLHLARAILGQDRPRARRLADEARRGFEDAGPAFTDRARDAAAVAR